MGAGHWRSVFLFGGALGGVVTVVVATELPETFPAAGVRGSPAARVASRHTFLRLLRSRPFLGYSLQVAFSIAFFYAFVAAAPGKALESLTESWMRELDNQEGLSLRSVVNGLEFGCGRRRLRGTRICRVPTGWAVPGGSADGEDRLGC